MPRSSLYGLLPHQVIGGFQWKLHWWVLGWYNLHALVEKGYMSVPLYNQEWIKKANGWVEYFTPSNLPTCIQWRKRNNMSNMLQNIMMVEYITISVLGSVGRLTKCRPNIIYQLTSNNFLSERNLLLSTGITVYYTQATLLNNIDWGFLVWQLSKLGVRQTSHTINSTFSLQVKK
jgi:hypothetical protein